VILLVVTVAAVVGAWVLVIQPKRDQAAKLSSQVNTAQSQLNSARADVAQGEIARREFGSAYAELAKLGEAVPADDNVPSLIYQIQSAASSAGVDFRSLQLNNNSAASTPTSSGSGSSAAKSANASLPPGVTVGQAGFPAEQFTFTFRGNFFRLADFFNRLQRFVVASNNRISVRGRLMTLNALNLGASTAGFPQITATVSATTYLVPASQGLLAGATPTGPAGASPAPSKTSVAGPTAAIAPPVP
jgi:hypothetical protein